MDFTNRSVPSQQHPGAEPSSSAPELNVKRNNTHRQSSEENKWSRIFVALGCAAILVLVISLIVLLASNNNNNTDKTEASYIKTTKLQAVFLNTGQVYFGNISVLNSQYMVLTNIYYLQTSSNGSSSSSSTSSNNNNVTLVKLGCELHRPYDQMVINRSQVTFWENLQSDGQVATAVAKYQQENPNHTCVDQSTSAGTTTGNTAQGANGNNASSGSSTSGQ